jgi:hypothetical protein
MHQGDRRGQHQAGLTCGDDDRLRPDAAVDSGQTVHPDPRPTWIEYYCALALVNVVIGNENYFLSADGLLMPTRKNQPPPDLRYFRQGQK